MNKNLARDVSLSDETTFVPHAHALVSQRSFNDLSGQVIAPHFALSRIVESANKPRARRENLLAC